MRHLAALFSPAPKDITRQLLHLGGIGLVPLGLLDSSVVPLPGSMDVATILLSARDKRLWFYYATMATLGSVLGGFLTYRIARRGGEQALTKRFSKKRVEKVVNTFDFRTLGLRCHRCSRAAPAAISVRAFRDRRRRYAVFANQIPDRFDHRPPDPLHAPRLPGRHLRTPNPLSLLASRIRHYFRRAWNRDRRRNHRPACP